MSGFRFLQLFYNLSAIDKRFMEKNDSMRTYSARVLSAGIVPGSPGLYQVNVQVPLNAVDGDLPVVCQVGAATSVPAVITIQK